MGALRLVHPTTQDDADLNQQRISLYLAKLIRSEFDQPVWELFFTAVGFLEIWYWFDPINLSHSIAVVGEDFEATPDPAVAATTMHFLAPICLFSIIRLRGKLSDWEAAERGRIFQDFEWRRVTANEFDQMDRTSVLANWRTKDTDLVLSSGKKFAHGAAAASLRELKESPGFSAPGEDWSALLVLVTSFNRIPAVPIAKAATLLQVEEKTVRNRIDRNELEAIPRKGTIWVTLRSIKHYLKTHYRATATFDLWSEVEAALKGKKGNLGNPGTF